MKQIILHLETVLDYHHSTNWAPNGVKIAVGNTKFTIDDAGSVIEVACLTEEMQHLINAARMSRYRRGDYVLDKVVAVSLADAIADLNSFLEFLKTKAPINYSDEVDNKYMYLYGEVKLQVFLVTTKDDKLSLTELKVPTTALSAEDREIFYDSRGKLLSRGIIVNREVSPVKQFADVLTVIKNIHAGIGIGKSSTLLNGAYEEPKDEFWSRWVRLQNEQLKQQTTQTRLAGSQSSRSAVADASSSAAAEAITRDDDKSSPSAKRPRRLRNSPAS